MQGELATTTAKLQVSKRALDATFDHLERRCSNEWAAEAAVQELMMSKLRNYIQTGILPK